MMDEQRLKRQPSHAPSIDHDTETLDSVIDPKRDLSEELIRNSSSISISEGSQYEPQKLANKLNAIKSHPNRKTNSAIIHTNSTTKSQTSKESVNGIEVKSQGKDLRKGVRASFGLALHPKAEKSKSSIETGVEKADDIKAPASRENKEIAISSNKTAVDKTTTEKIAESKSPWGSTSATEPKAQTLAKPNKQKNAKKSVNANLDRSAKKSKTNKSKTKITDQVQPPVSDQKEVTTDANAVENQIKTEKLAESKSDTKPNQHALEEPGNAEITSDNKRKKSKNLEGATKKSITKQKTSKTKPNSEEARNEQKTSDGNPGGSTAQTDKPKKIPPVASKAKPPTNKVSKKPAQKKA